VQLDCIEILAQLGLIYPINLGGLTPARLGLKSYNGVTFIRLPEPFRRVTSVAQIEGHPYYHIILAYLVGSTSLPESLEFKVGTETIAIQELLEWLRSVPFARKVPKRSLTAAAEVVMGKSCFFHGAIPIASYGPSDLGGIDGLCERWHGAKAYDPLNDAW
jgi:hypothetical protein